MRARYEQWELNSINLVEVNFGTWCLAVYGPSTSFVLLESSTLSVESENKWTFKRNQI